MRGRSGFGWSQFIAIGTLIAVCPVAFGIDCILMAFTDMGRPGRW